MEQVSNRAAEILLHDDAATDSRSVQTTARTQ
jgi:hypothetical protein